ncbi:SDR family NAD(P)-dependent oxidoreductase [Stenotrophobium rhamnosiphilum]|uniref:Short-chain dehydrogenase n=1 Tax=Stenotrophobium rhamnosiphilum TaxID=2029166 RepID=A0A2T5MEG9_9GAMM|nr:SDR family NAD(P)-dependent oxidoreductase [Stenotrophobium rhamnosiphilum]PTU30952.1 hypothetical protein CJD38_11640 [Stenotrophobium rhamnosiphilum]
MPTKTQSPLSAIRRSLISAPYAERTDLRGKTAIVTGTAPNSIGYETARTLARWGAKVIVTTRSNPEIIATRIGEEFALEDCTATIDSHPLDLSVASSVSSFASWYRATHGEYLDILINNAGIHLDLLSQRKEPHLSADGFEIQWRTNYLGTMHLTHALLPLLQNAGRDRGDARIVTVVSQLHTKGINAALFAPVVPYNSWTAYGTSKLALVHATYELQRRYAASDHVQSYCLHPGAVFTNIADKGLAGNPMLGTIRKTMAPIERFFLLTPEEGAQTQIHCATKSGLNGGLYYQKCRPTSSSPDSQDAKISERLWETTTAWANAAS